MFLCTGDPKFVQKTQTIFPGEAVRTIRAGALLDDRKIQDGKEMVIIDLEPGFNAMEHLPNRFPVLTCPCLALSNVPSYEEAVALMAYGIRGYGNKYMLGENFRQAVSTVATGQLWLMPSILNRFIQKMAVSPATEGGKDAAAFWAAVSKREKEVALYISKGFSNQEIADAMFVSLRTVKGHLTSIFGKTGCRDRMDLALRVNQMR